MRIIGWALLGLLLGGVIALAGATAAIPIFDIPQFEGAYAMGVVFTIIPAGAIIGALAGLIFGIVRRTR